MNREVYISECIGVLCCALSFVGWVTQSKDNGPFIQAGHGFDDIVGEERASASHTWKTGRESVVQLSRLKGMVCHKPA